ncbi:hypothetical protein DM860_010346 [Cuscuta australis]|uniref:Helicase MOV-10-like beta-barrel domain-containing protein n=1 Tax=Cuscuta australis TaxID=267555 RepID=A0A328E4K8_9ASTE|nr:hypothetical protein DM860_010346 [Cuscuta australis]
MDLIRAFVAIFRYVVCCGEEDPSESHWRQQRHHYSQIRDTHSSYPSYETRRTTFTPTPPFTTQSKLPSKPSHRNAFQANELSSSPPPPPPPVKPTPTTTTSPRLGEVLPQPRSFSYSSPASPKASGEVVSTKPRDSVLPPFPASHKASSTEVVSKKPSHSSQSSQIKFLLSNTAKLPPSSPSHSPKPTSSFPAPSQKRPALSTKPALPVDSPTVKFPPHPPVTANTPTTIITSSSLSEVFRQPKSFGYSSPSSHKANEVSTKPRDLFSSSSITPKQNEVSKLQSFPSSALSLQVIEAAHTRSFNTIIKTNTTKENKGTTPLCSHHLPSPLPSSRSPQDKLLLSNTTKLLAPSPSPSPKPPSTFMSPIQKKLSLSTKPALRVDSAKNHNAKKNYIWVEKGASPTYVAPDDLKELLKKDVVPQVLKKPLSISTYKDYFRALLYAEDVYIEKWDGFEMKDVTLELHDAAIYKRKSRHERFDEDDPKHEKTFVAFEIDKVPERRPFLISRDFVTLKPSEKKFPIFEGLVYRVVRSNLLLSEFEDDFLKQHRPACKYDVKFSFNRVCLKRAHQAIEYASGPLFRNFLFPEILPESRLFSNQYSVIIDKIMRLRASPPYLVKNELSVIRDRKTPPYLSETGDLIVNAVVRLIHASPLNRILLCAPANKTCDLLLR